MPALGDPCTRNWQDKHPAVKSTPKKDGSLTRRPGELSRCVGRRDSGFGVSDPQGQLLNPTISMHAVLSAVGAPAPRLGQTAPAPAPRVCHRRGRGQTQDGRRRATRARAPRVSRGTLPAPPPSDPRISPFTAVPQFLIFLLFLLPGLALRHEDDADGGNEKNERGTGITRAAGASTRRDPRTRSAAA